VIEWDFDGVEKKREWSGIEEDVYFEEWGRREILEKMIEMERELGIGFRVICLGEWNGLEV